MQKSFTKDLGFVTFKKLLGDSEYKMIFVHQYGCFALDKQTTLSTRYMKELWELY